eukprot:TRINITY_DN9053_c0_g1_i1.p2 TRINITY_DN9053_c0_g1~~TRINITY_DN9053_c0_g1_i1.p2  ORF type:complete len:150 (-),score=23.68 TRINITY_DN9053_c0_g1_i1:24-473(-)
MKKLQLDMLKIENDYMIIENDTFKIIFTNAENSRNFNRATDSGINELNSIKEEFRLWDVIYLKQIHSDKVLVYSLDKYIKDMEGDAIVTQEKNVAIGVFTADCVPCLLYTSDAADEEDSVDLGGRRIIRNKRNIEWVKQSWKIERKTRM